ncbi:CocE/NonD family hydrolase [Archangium lipolyticum]|uniref:CocE/NonD family hydrolase n=1 Tax=Archangium lipolyticum TaxID=2970465 RepID=UPI002149A54A|nr:CocE/NonD family hydrolase [Archangium lipolyticum]
MRSVRAFWVRCFVVLLGCCTVGCGLVRNAIQEDRRSSHELPAFTHEPGSWRTEAVRMRDGVELSTRIFLPKGVERAPVVLIRNPYDLGPFIDLTCDLFVRYGLGCVLQDVRGRMASGGEWWPLMNEVSDGQDTLRWLVGQPFVDGNIALYGMSYLGGTALAAMTGELPVEVRTVVVSVFGTDLREVVSERGHLPHELLTAWAAFMPGRQGTRASAGKAYRKMLEHRPHLEADVAATGAPLPFYREWLNALEPGGGLWRRPETEALRRMPERLPVPMLLVGGFDDPFLPATLRTWESLASRDRSVMVLGPWNHVGAQSGAVKTPGIKDDMNQWGFTIPWLRHALQGVPLPYEAGRVVVAGHGDSGARVLPTWPPATREQVFFLDTAPAGGAPGACASASLGAQPPAASASLTYRYDPAEPWRSEGGARGLAFAMLGRQGITPGPVVQTWPCARQDVLRFVGPAAESDMRIAGRARLRLRVRSSAEDTAFVAKLVDVDAEGRALHVTDGAATLRLPLADTLEPLPYALGSEREVEIDFYPASWVLAKGHRLGLWVSSSNYPMLSAHLNTARPWYEETTPVVAAQTVELGGGEGASRLLLPVELPGGIP